MGKPWRWWGWLECRSWFDRLHFSFFSLNNANRVEREEKNKKSMQRRFNCEFRRRLFILCPLILASRSPRMFSASEFCFSSSLDELARCQSVEASVMGNKRLNHFRMKEEHKRLLIYGIQEGNDCLAICNIKHIRKITVREMNVNKCTLWNWKDVEKDFEERRSDEMRKWIKRYASVWRMKWYSCRSEAISKTNRRALASWGNEGNNIALPAAVSCSCDYDANEFSYCAVVCGQHTSKEL